MTHVPPIDVAASFAPAGPLLPTLSSAAAAGSRLLHDSRLAPLWRSLMPADGTADALQLIAAADSGGAPCFTVALDCDAGRFEADIATDDAAVAIAGATDTDDALRSLAALALLGEPVRRLAATVLPGLRVLTVTSQSNPSGGWCAVRQGGEELTRIVFRALPEGVQVSLASAAGASRCSAAFRSKLCVAARVNIAQRTCHLKTLRTLNAGDVLILPIEAASLEGVAAALTLEAGSGRRLVAHGQVRDGCFTILGDLTMMNDDLALEVDTEAAPNVLDDLELAVHFELETVGMPLSDLEAIQPGYVIEFAMPLAQARLRLVACGHVIGHADLVAVADRLGARITRLVAS